MVVLSSPSPNSPYSLWWTLSNIELAEIPAVKIGGKRTPLTRQRLTLTPLVIKGCGGAGAGAFPFTDTTTCNFELFRNFRASLRFKSAAGGSQWWESIPPSGHGFRAARERRRSTGGLGLASLTVHSQSFGPGTRELSTLKGAGVRKTLPWAGLA